MKITMNRLYFTPPDGGANRVSDSDLGVQGYVQIESGGPIGTAVRNTCVMVEYKHKAATPTLAVWASTGLPPAPNGRSMGSEAENAEYFSVSITSNSRTAVGKGVAELVKKIKASPLYAGFITRHRQDTKGFYLLTPGGHGGKGAFSRSKQTMVKLDGTKETLREAVRRLTRCIECDDGKIVYQVRALDCAPYDGAKTAKYEVMLDQDAPGTRKEGAVVERLAETIRQSEMYQHCFYFMEHADRLAEQEEAAKEQRRTMMSICKACHRIERIGPGDISPAIFEACHTILDRAPFLRIKPVCGNCRGGGDVILFFEDRLDGLTAGSE